MKLIKYANKNFLRISRIEWENIGIENNWLIIEARSYPDYIELEEFIRRLKRCGWTVGLNDAGDNYFSYIHTTGGKYYSLSTGRKAWKVTNGWKQNYRQLRSQCPDLASFIFAINFKIPENFDIRTQEFIKEKTSQYEQKTVPFARLPYNELINKEYEIFYNGEWRYIEDIDFKDNIIAFDAHTFITFTPTSPITIRKKVK